jgi:hypothetical protein
LAEDAIEAVVRLTIAVVVIAIADLGRREADLWEFAIVATGHGPFRLALGVAEVFETGDAIEGLVEIVVTIIIESVADLGCEGTDLRILVVAIVTATGHIDGAVAVGVVFVVRAVEAVIIEVVTDLLSAGITGRAVIIAVVAVRAEDHVEVGVAILVFDDDAVAVVVSAIAELGRAGVG